MVIASYFSNDDEATRLEAEFNETENKRVHVIKQDLSNLDEIVQFAEKIQCLIPHLDLIVFNAGQTDRAELKDIRLKNWLNVLNVNLNSPVFILQSLLSTMAKGSNVLFISSILSLHPHSMSLSYGVSKSAINALVANLVKFLVPYAIRVNAIVPGFIETPWHDAKSAEVLNSIKSKISLGHFCQPDDVVDFAMSVMKNSYINGQSLVIDGGYQYK